MASKDTFTYFKDLRDISPLRATAETMVNNSNVKLITAKEAYQLARKQPGVSETDLLIYPDFAKQIGLPKGAKVLNDCHGKIIGRTAKAYRYYNKLKPTDKDKVEGDLREAMFQMSKYPLYKAEAVLGMHKDCMIKATFVTTESDIINVFNWLCNFTPYELIKEKYEKSTKIPVLDIILIAFNEWTCDDPFYNNVGAPQLALVDEKQNTLIILGMRYFGERKKGTLTLGWTSGMNMGYAACHGGIKEIDFTTCKDKKYHKLGKRSMTFFGLSGTGKSAHTNSHDNAGTLPAGFSRLTLHDDAYQIDTKRKICLGWEPTMFDKTDSREPDNPDWKYMISLMNHSIIDIKGKKMPVGLDIRQDNGRALLSRDVLGQTCDSCSFPKALAWLMIDTALPPIIKFSDDYLAIAMGAALITMRNKAENVKAEELGKLVFEPFANPFRIYELHKDVEAFLTIAENKAEFYSFNSRGYWKDSNDVTEKIPLQTSLTIQSAILTDSLEWEKWDMLPGAMIPTKASIDKILPGYYERYNPKKRNNMAEYKALLKDRFQQRIDFLNGSDLASKPELLKKLVKALKVNVK
jgi:phosphoenolpyruvate carboxykinase (ATP)